MVLLTRDTTLAFLSRLNWIKFDMGEVRHSPGDIAMPRCYSNRWLVFYSSFFIRPAGLMILVCFLLTYALKLHHCHYYFHTNSKQCVVVVVVVVDTLYLTIKAVIYAHNLAPVSVVSWKPVFHEFYCKRGHIRRLVCTPFVSATKVSSTCTHIFGPNWNNEWKLTKFQLWR